MTSLHHRHRPALLLLLLTACSFYAPPTESFAADKLVVYSGRAERLIKPVFDAFTAKTGIQVDLLSSGTTELVNRLKAEGDRTPADLLLTNDAGSLELARGAGLLRPLNMREVERAIPSQFRAADNSWVGLSGRFWIIVYNTAMVKPDQVGSLLDLAQPQWKDKIAIPNSGSEYLQAGVSVIRASAQMLLGILNDVLDISKIEAGALSLSSAPFDLAPFGEGLRRLYEPLAQEKGLTFTLTVTETEALPRIGDEVRLRQILSNLISNALKFTDEGSIRVEINAHGDDVVMSVHDTGVGIAPQDQAQVFDKFVQSTRTHTGAGSTGLGLAICRAIVEDHGGRIWAANNAERGAIFSVLLPVTRIPRTQNVLST